MNDRPAYLTVLGSTGSIGVSTLDVVCRHPERFRVFALTGLSRLEVLLEQVRRVQPKFVVVPHPERAALVRDRLRAEGVATNVLESASDLEWVAAHPEVDQVMAAIVGAAGLRPCIAAARAGKRLLLANKEALVVGGDLFAGLVQRHGCTLLPIDSEHSAVFQCLPTDRDLWGRQVQRIVLTASGGPFRAWPVAALREVTPAQACKHPNWSMGQKISVDSATMMNKALEVIEAHYLFQMPPDQLAVLIHPQSVIHSMVEFRDASVIAQLGTPDMRVPIALGLFWPERLESGAPRLDFVRAGMLTFESPDEGEHPARFPGLAMAWRALSGPAGSAAVLNAANEVAVDAFLRQRLRFDQIHRVNEAAMDRIDPGPVSTLDDVLALDTRSRALAEEEVRRCS